MTNVTVGINDDYASLSVGGIRFYYGYEHIDEDGMWMFVVIDGNNGILWSLSDAEICDGRKGFTEFGRTSEVILFCIGLFFEQHNLLGHL